MLARLFCAILLFFSSALALANEAQDRLLFDSTRSGSFGIYTSNFDGSDVRALIDEERHEICPDPSPDGRLVVFAVPHVLKREGPGDVWLAKSDGTQVELLVKDASFPTFSGDGKSIYFQRGVHEVRQLELASKHEKRIFPFKAKDIGKFQIVVPRVSPDGKKLAFASDKPRRWASWVADLETHELSQVGWGCQPSWYSDSKRIAWISSRKALERTAIHHADLDTNERAILHDLDAPLGHEYFPTLAFNDTLLFYAAASPGRHDHLDADYQIFIKDLKSGKLSQITNDAFNNRWPKHLKTSKTSQ